eukprot:536499_1
MTRRSARIAALESQEKFNEDDKFSYINWMDTEWINTKQLKQSDLDRQFNVTTWQQFVERIGKHKLKKFKCNEQVGNACVVYSCINAWEIQHNKLYPKEKIESIGGFKTSVKKGSKIRYEVPRIWKQYDNKPRPKSILLRGHFTVKMICNLLEQGLVIAGITELGYPWANKAYDDEYGERDPFIVPRFDPYNNTWLPKQKRGADNHSICIIGMFHSNDKFEDVLSNQTNRKGQPIRKKNDKFKNVFVVKNSNLPCGWIGNWSKKIGKHKYKVDEFCYALLPMDLLTKPIRSTNNDKRIIDELFSVTDVENTKKKKNNKKRKLIGINNDNCRKKRRFD